GGARLPPGPTTAAAPPARRAGPPPGKPPPRRPLSPSQRPKRSEAAAARRGGAVTPAARSGSAARWSARCSSLGMPSDGLGEALARNALPVTANVVDAARQRERREERVSGVGHVQRGAELGQRRILARSRTVEQPHSKHDAPSAGPGESVRLLLGRERGEQ